MAEFRIVHDFGKLVRAFESAPEATKKAVRLQVKMAARDIQERAREHHRFISRTGTTERIGIDKQVGDTEATVFLATPTAIFQHEGTKTHLIEPRNKTVLRFVSQSKFVFARRVMHPGIKPDPYLYRAADDCAPTIQKRFETAIDKILGGV